MLFYREPILENSTKVSNDTFLGQIDQIPIMLESDMENKLNGNLF